MAPEIDDDNEPFAISTRPRRELPGKRRFEGRAPARGDAEIQRKPTCSGGSSSRDGSIGMGRSERQGASRWPAIAAGKGRPASSAAVSAIRRMSDGVVGTAPPHGAASRQGPTPVSPPIAAGVARRWAEAEVGGTTVAWPGPQQQEPPRQRRAHLQRWWPFCPSEWPAPGVSEASLPAAAVLQAVPVNPPITSSATISQWAARRCRKMQGRRSTGQAFPRNAGRTVTAEAGVQNRSPSSTVAPRPSRGWSPGTSVDGLARRSARIRLVFWIEGAHRRTCNRSLV